MGTRSTAIVLLSVLALAGCSGDDSGEGPAGPTARPTTNADCATLIPPNVLTGLGWTPHGRPEETVRGCHREAEQGYVEVRDRPGASYTKLCRTLDRTGGVGPGTPVDWLGAGVTACAVEPASGLGTTKVLVDKGDGVREISVAVLAATDQAKIRAAVAALS